MRLRRALNLSVSQLHQDRPQQGDRAGREQYEFGQRRELRHPVDGAAGARVAEKAASGEEKTAGKEGQEEA